MVGAPLVGDVVGRYVGVVVGVPLVGDVVGDVVGLKVVGAMVGAPLGGDVVGFEVVGGTVGWEVVGVVGRSKHTHVWTGSQSPVLLPAESKFRKYCPPPLQIRAQYGGKFMVDV